MTDIPESTKPESNNLFLIQTRRLPESIEGLNTSPAQSAGELWPKKYRPSEWPAQGSRRTVYHRDGEPIYYHGPHELWNIAGKFILKFYLYLAKRKQGEKVCM